MTRARAEQRFLGGPPADPDGLRAFGEAAESLVLRWNENGHPLDAQAMCDRAEQILTELGAGRLAGRAVPCCKAVSMPASPRWPRRSPPRCPSPGRLTSRRSRTGWPGSRNTAAPRRKRVEAEAEAATRLVRWLAAGEARPATVAAGVHRPDAGLGLGGPRTGHHHQPGHGPHPPGRTAYAALHQAVRDRRAELDGAFAARLAAWSPAAGPTEDLLLAENVLERVARPLADQAAPLIVVVDGMSAAVACVLADEIATLRIWDEAGRHADGREGALTVLPSITTFSRTSLLCGRLQAGGQAEEQAGFAAFWRGRAAALFHKAELPAGPGARLSAAVRAALSEPSTVVGVVLNTVDESLREGKPGSAPAWRLADVTYLPELLTAAAGAGRPVVLTSDHGHILDRGRASTRPPPRRHATGPGPPVRGRYS